MAFNIPGSRYHAGHSFSCPPSSSLISQNYQILKNDIAFTTTSQDFQKAHEYNIYIPEEFLYKISWICIWEATTKEKGHDISILLNDTKNLPYEEFSEASMGTHLDNLPYGNNNISFFVRTKESNSEIKLLYSKLEIEKIYN